MTTKRYILLSAAALIFVSVLTYTGTSFAQVYSAPSCSTNASPIYANQNVVFTGAGGNGTYTWSADSSNVITNSLNNQLTAYFPSSGTYTVRVMSNGQTGTCTVTVLPNSSSNVVTNTFTSNNNLACSPSSQEVSVGQTASFSASGGNGSYFWSIPELSLSNSSGTGSYVTYSTPGTRTITVSSGGSSASCVVNVIGSAVTPVVPGPGLPNTGGGYGRW